MYQPSTSKTPWKSKFNTCNSMVCVGVSGLLTQSALSSPRSLSPPPSPQTERPWLLSVCSGLMFVCIFNFYVLTVGLSDGMGESFLLSKDGPLTPNIDGVVALWIFRRRAQNTKIGRKSAKIGPLESSFYLFSPPPPRPMCTGVIFPSTAMIVEAYGKLSSGGENK